MGMNKYLNFCDIYTLLWCFYIWHSSTQETASRISQFVLLVCIAWSFVCMLKAFQRYKMPVYFRGLNLLVIMYTIYGMFRLLEGRYFLPYGGSIDGFYSLKKVYISLIPIYAFFYYAKLGQLNVARLKRYSLLFLVMSFMAYYAYYTKRYGIELDDDAEYTNNSGYKFLAMMPIILFWRNKPIVYYSFLAIVTIMIVMCMKRGAMVSGFFALTIILYYSMRKLPVKRKFFYLILTIGLLVILLFYVSYLVENSAYFMHRYNDTMEGYASGRDEMYPMFLSYIFNRQSFFSLLLGDGLDGSLKNLGKYCHNDWFEIMIDEGFLGLCCFLLYWYYFYENSRHFKMDIWLYTPLLTILVITFLNTLYSFSINNMSIYVTSVLGYCLSQPKTETNTHK